MIWFAIAINVFAIVFNALVLAANISSGNVGFAYINGACIVLNTAMIIWLVSLL